MFQTKLTYGMICYILGTRRVKSFWLRFKLSWLMLWFVIKIKNQWVLMVLSCFKLSWLMLWFVILYSIAANGAKGEFQTKLTYVMICYLNAPVGVLPDIKVSN